MEELHPLPTFARCGSGGGLNTSPDRRRSIIQRQNDLGPGLSRAVDGADDLDRFATLAAVNQRVASLVDGLEKVDELVAVSDVGDAAGIAGACFEAGPAGHGGEDLVVTGDPLLELPERDVVLLDPSRAAIAVDLAPLQQPRIDARG